MAPLLKLLRQRLTAFSGKRLATMGIIAALAFGALAPLSAEAQRIGKNRSMGRQSQTAPAQVPGGQSSQRAQQAQSPQAPPSTGAPARNRWMGPLAGLAAGLGIAALLSHFGLAEGLAQMLSNALLIGLAIFAIVALYRFITRKRRPVVAYPDGTQACEFSQPIQRASQTSEVAAAASGSAQLSQDAGVLPFGFDRNGFLREAKVLFVRLQAAWDKNDQGDLFELATPQMFAEIRLDLEGRGSSPNRTDVVELHAELLSTASHGVEQLASVKFHGLMREGFDDAAHRFEEIWNLVKQTPESGWQLAGIEQIE
ncbi:Tim44 domain-containing protein [Paraburkholderia sp. RL17-373-BIF-A]|uniref:Tim44 domain-containing protein n=1 Tax=Paraburkholderia sp. RL17-373-BIF-A TaxID=3031629 RepID=UPI0038BC4962